MRVEVQNRIQTMCREYAFPKVTYDKTTKLASSGPDTKNASTVVVNEISSSPSNKIKYGARDGNLGMADWRFEARLAFTCEVDTYTFLTQGIKPVTFIYDNTRIRIGSIGAPTVHPPRQGAHNGTEMVITFSVNTRR